MMMMMMMMMTHWIASLASIRRPSQTQPSRSAAATAYIQQQTLINGPSAEGNIPY